MIKRRVVLTGLAAMVAGPVFAQSQSARRPGIGNAGTPEMQWIEQMTPIGSLSLAVSRVAQEKAQFSKLKEFAQFEVAEQETVADVLKSLQNAGIVNGIIKPPSEAEVEEHLDAQGKQALQMMRSAQAGSTFDRDYLDAQTDGHQKLLRIQEDYLKFGRNIDAVNVAKLASGMIKEHLQLLADIKADMAAAASTGAAPAAPRR
jgi:putative membrane protein